MTKSQKSQKSNVKSQIRIKPKLHKVKMQKVKLIKEKNIKWYSHHPNPHHCQVAWTIPQCLLLPWQNIKTQNIESQNIERTISRYKRSSRKISKSQNIDEEKYRKCRISNHKIPNMHNIESSNIEYARDWRTKFRKENSKRKISKGQNIEVAKYRRQHIEVAKYRKDYISKDKISNAKNQMQNIEAVKYRTQNIEVAKYRKQNIEHKITIWLSIKS